MGQFLLLCRAPAGWGQFFGIMASSDDEEMILECRTSMSTMNLDGASISLSNYNHHGSSASSDYDLEGADKDGGPSGVASRPVPIETSIEQHFPHVGIIIACLPIN